MAHPEIELISNIVETGDFTSLKRKGVTPDFFRLADTKEIFRWLWDQFHDPQHRGEVPTVDRLQRKFPDFDFSPSRNSISALVSEIKKESIQIELNDIVGGIAEALHEDEDPSCILDSFLPKFRRLNLESHSDEGVLISNAAEIIRQEYETQKTHGGVVGIPYPWDVLNRQTGGMRDEEFIVIYGRPGNMKTWLLCAMAAHAYECNQRVMVFSKEINTQAILTRIASVLTGVDYGDLKRGTLSPEDEQYVNDYLESMEKAEELDSKGGHRRALLSVSDKGKRRASSVEDLIAVAERFEPDIVFVDGLYLMRDSRSGSKTVDWKQISHISQDLKGMAQYLQCPVVGTTQANRQNAKNPTGDLDDLSYSDGLGQDADVAFRAFRGPHPSGSGATLMLVFSKVREAIVRPFVINANPGGDFSVLHRSVNIKSFLEEKSRMEASEGQQMVAGGDNSVGVQKRPKKRTNPFRD